MIDPTVFNGGPERPYNQFYAAVKDRGRYEIVPYPSDADLILEVGWRLTDTGLKVPVLGQLRVVAIDPRTHTPLWSLTPVCTGSAPVGKPR